MGFNKLLTLKADATCHGSRAIYPKVLTGTPLPISSFSETTEGIQSPSRPIQPRGHCGIEVVESPAEIDRPVRLAAFDLDGTLLKGETVCEAIASGIGRSERMQELEQLQYTQIEEIAAAREEMAKWYFRHELQELCGHLTKIRFATGLEEGFAVLRNHGVRIAIVSLTWQFAVKWFAKRMSVHHCVGVGLSPKGRITHFWSADKDLWLRKLAQDSGFEMCDVAAVGDSGGDIAMLSAVGHSFWVGESVPHELEGRVIHQPDGDISEITRRIVKNIRESG